MYLHFFKGSYINDFKSAARHWEKFKGSGGEVDAGDERRGDPTFIGYFSGIASLLITRPRPKRPGAES